jgi:hypothetical protein
MDRYETRKCSPLVAQRHRLVCTSKNATQSYGEAIRAGHSTFFKYSKTNYRIDDSEHFDEIIISSSGCYGTCPNNDISINKNGQVIYFGDEYNTVNGYYKSKVSSAKYFQSWKLILRKLTLKTCKTYIPLIGQMTKPFL